jgi:uncharacterized protein (TIGR02246 family)
MTMKRFKRISLPAYAFAAMFLLVLVAWPAAAGARGLKCVPVTKDKIANLFVRWNNALQKSTPEKPDDVVNLYAKDAILLPTVENGPYTNHTQIRKYFVHFLENKPSGKIDKSEIRVGCNMAFDSGLYTFTYAKCPQPPQPPDPKCPATVKARYTYVYKHVGGTWLIWHHHSSVQPVKQ